MGGSNRSEGGLALIAKPTGFSGRMLARVSLPTPCFALDSGPSVHARWTRTGGRWIWMSGGRHKDNTFK